MLQDPNNYSASERFFLCVLVDKKDEWLTKAQLRAETGIPERALSRKLRKLVADGYLEVRPLEGKPSCPPVNYYRQKRAEDVDPDQDAGMQS